MARNLHLGAYYVKSNVAFCLAVLGDSNGLERKKFGNAFLKFLSFVQPRIGDQRSILSETEQIIIETKRFIKNSFRTILVSY